MLKKTVSLTLFMLLALAGFVSAVPASARPCTSGACHQPVPTPPAPNPPSNPVPRPEPDPEPLPEEECIDTDGDGEEDDECQSIEVEELGAGTTLMP